MVCYTNRMNTKAIGNVTEAMVMAAFVKKGLPLLLPFGDNHRYDMVVEFQGGFRRVQCKTGRLRNGAIVFNACSSYAHRGGSPKFYNGAADFFAVYCPETDKVYLVPVPDKQTTEMTLRVEPSKNNQVTNIRLASEFLL